jgi:hypothetical protein
MSFATSTEVFDVTKATLSQAKVLFYLIRTFSSKKRMDRFSKHAKALQHPICAQETKNLLNICDDTPAIQVLIRMLEFVQQDANTRDPETNDPYKVPEYSIVVPLPPQIQQQLDQEARVADQARRLLQESEERRINLLARSTMAPPQPRPRIDPLPTQPPQLRPRVDPLPTVPLPHDLQFAPLDIADPRSIKTQLRDYERIQRHRQRQRHRHVPGYYKGMESSAEDDSDSSYAPSCGGSSNVTI